MITLRTIVLAASVFALLPLGAMGAPTDTSAGGNPPAATSTTHHKKPVHHVSHKAHKPKTTSTSSQS